MKGGGESFARLREAFILDCFRVILNERVKNGGASGGWRRVVVRVGGW